MKQIQGSRGTPVPINKPRRPRNVWVAASHAGDFIFIDTAPPLRIALAPLFKLRARQGSDLVPLPLNAVAQLKELAFKRLNGHLDADKMRKLTIYLVNNEENFPVEASSGLTIDERRTFGGIRGKAAVLTAINGHRDPQFIEGLETALGYMQNDQAFVAQRLIPTPYQIILSPTMGVQQGGNYQVSYEVANAYIFFLAAYHHVTRANERKQFFEPNLTSEQFSQFLVI